MAKRLVSFAFQLPEDLVNIAAQIVAARGNGHTGKPWTVQDFVRRSIALMCRKMIASRGKAFQTFQFQAREAFLSAVGDDELAELVLAKPLDQELPGKDPESGVDLGAEARRLGQ